MAVHVDDLICTGTTLFKEHITDKLRSRYPFKHWKTDGGEFLGRVIHRSPDGFTIEQTEYAEKLNTIKITRERRRDKGQPLTDREKSQLRGVAGGLNWLSTATRPDLAAMTAKVQQNIQNGTVEQIAEANKAVAEARDFKHVAIKVVPIPLNELAILMTADASWATESDLKSQAAYMVCATTKAMHSGKITPVTPLKWKSQKQDRAVSSTLAAELYTVSKGVAEAVWMKQFFLEVLNSEYDLDNQEELTHDIDIIACTDNKPLFDHVRNDTGMVHDKRQAIEVLLLRRDIKMHRVHIRWIDTKQMPVDCMTKLSVRPTLSRHVLQQSTYAIMEEQEMLNAKRAQRQYKQSHMQQSGVCEM